MVGQHHLNRARRPHPSGWGEITPSVSILQSEVDASDTGPLTPTPEEDVLLTPQFAYDVCREGVRQVAGDSSTEGSVSTARCDSVIPRIISRGRVNRPVRIRPFSATFAQIKLERFRDISPPYRYKPLLHPRSGICGMPGAPYARAAAQTLSHLKNYQITSYFPFSQSNSKICKCI